VSGDDRGAARSEGQDFIRAIIADDLASGRHAGVVTRFPPEPNGYLHIGHAKAICLELRPGRRSRPERGRCHLRFDDTNPTKEEQEYIDAILADVRWLGFDWGEHLYYASDYFEQLYGFAVQLIRKGKAYVDDQTAEEIRAKPGSLTRAGSRQPVPQAERRGEPRPVRAHARGRVPGRQRACCGPGSTWHRPT
jgi:glutaminyl-tRNA synthetase